LFDSNMTLCIMLAPWLNPKEVGKYNDSQAEHGALRISGIRQPGSWEEASGKNQMDSSLLFRFFFS
jgi:hypothetical protein